MQSEPSTPPETKVRKYLKMLKGYGFTALGILVLFFGVWLFHWWSAGACQCF